MNREKAWYDRYDELIASVKEKKQNYESRCEELGVSPSRVAKDIWNELIARAVKESNWQEGLELELDKTRELAIEAFDELKAIAEPHLDMIALLDYHKKNVANMKKGGASREEIGAYNLSAAHSLIPAITLEIYTRLMAMLCQFVETVKKDVDKEGEKDSVEMLKIEEVFSGEKAQKAFGIIDKWRKRNDPISYPVTPNIKTKGEYFSSLVDGEQKIMSSVFNPIYIHFLHKLILTGIYPGNRTGKFRKKPVSVGRESVHFAPPSLIPGLTDELCDDFLSIFVENQDPILNAAKLSYRFVSIHPYSDGNGRISRLLMNLILWISEYPPIYLKADKKGKHRYSVALLRANRGNFKPLASLIALSLNDIYDKLYAAIKPLE